MNYCFFPEKEDVIINRVYELLWYHLHSRILLHNTDSKDLDTTPFYTVQQPQDDCGIIVDSGPSGSGSACT